MVLYSCNYCEYCSDDKTKMERHLNKKKPCYLQHTNMVKSELKIETPSENAHFSLRKPPFSPFSLPFSAEKNDPLICSYCKKKFKRRDNVIRHMRKNCKILKNNWIEEESGQSSLEAENSHLKDRIKELEIQLKNKPQIINNTINTYNNQINQQFNQQININGYGKEDISYITKDMANEYLEFPYTSIPNIIKSIHFHPQHPENHNIKITNRKEPYAKVYLDNKWILRDKNEVIDDLRDKGKNILDDLRDEELHSGFKNNCYNNFLDKIDNHDKDLLKKTNKDIELLIINNSDRDRDIQT